MEKSESKSLTVTWVGLKHSTSKCWPILGEKKDIKLFIGFGKTTKLIEGLGNRNDE